jgi:tetratricopeptide (TPR) repeat protein
LSADEIRKEGFCGKVIKRSIGLSDEDMVRLYKISVLKYPLSELDTANLLDVTVDSLLPFFKRLSERGIFNEDHEWFQHELIQKCIEDDLSNEQKKRYHRYAADLFLELLHQDMHSPLVNRNNSIAYAYHVYHADQPHESYLYNKSLAEVASKMGDLDLAERCYRRAIDNAYNLGNNIAHVVCLINLSRNVLNIWNKYDDSIANYRWILNNFSPRDEVSEIILMIDLAHVLY